MKMNKLFPSKFLSAGDLEEQDRTFTIRSSQLEEIGRGEDAEMKLVIQFEEANKPFVCNKTNAMTIEALYGDDTDDWEGQKVTLYPTEVNFGSETVVGIRIRKKRPTDGKKKNGAIKPGKRTGPDDVGPADDLDEFQEIHDQLPSKQPPF